MTHADIRVKMGRESGAEHELIDVGYYEDPQERAPQTKVVSGGPQTICGDRVGCTEHIGPGDSEVRSLLVDGSTLTSAPASIHDQAVRL